jgi:membrane protein DedA with SNARE-associated domain
MRSISQKEYEKIMMYAKIGSVIFAQLCFYIGAFLGIFYFPKDNYYQAVILLIWFMGIAVYVLHYQLVPFFIEKLLKIKIERVDE